MSKTYRLRWLGRRPYSDVYHAMRRFTEDRRHDPDFDDEFWIVEHDPVFTLGQSGKKEHLLSPGLIPVVCSDRGGQVTYHGPGQVVIYTLLNLRALKLGVRAYVTILEQAIINLLTELQIISYSDLKAPGVYVGSAKIASLGLRVRNGCCYHGISFNLDMDLTPFERINPCGYPGLKVTQLVDLGVQMSFESVAKKLVLNLTSQLQYDHPIGVRDFVL